MGQFDDQLPKDHSVDVLAQLVQHKPAANLSFAHDRHGVALGRQPHLGPEQQQTKTGLRQDSRSVWHVGNAEHGDKPEPEPEEHKDLLVDDVHRQHTQALQLLDGAGRTVLVERAHGYLGKDAIHRVGAVLAVVQTELQRLHAVRAELAVEKVVQEPQLADDVDQVEQLAREKAHRVRVQRVHVVGEVACNQPDAVRPRLVTHQAPKVDG